MTKVADDSTRTRILETVEDLIMERGFNAISYQDVSERVGIRKASVHHHFPSKADLGAAVIALYAQRLRTLSATARQAPATTHTGMLEHFLEVFSAIASSKRRICLAGVLGAEFETLPEAMKAEVRGFYGFAHAMLGELLEAGRKAGEFYFPGRSEDHARVIVSSLEGALIIGRALGDAQQVQLAIADARARVGLKPRKPQ